jgi:small subunit ribosomal protein S8e
MTKIAAPKRKVTRVKGGTSKSVLLKSDSINLIDPKSRKATVGKIQMVVDNPANRNFVRANVLTKGTVVNTDKGKARITNRPGQEGTVNGVLVE